MPFHNKRPPLKFKDAYSENGPPLLAHLLLSVERILLGLVENGNAHLAIDIHCERSRASSNFVDDEFDEYSKTHTHSEMKRVAARAYRSGAKNWAS